MRHILALALTTGLFGCVTLTDERLTNTAALTGLERPADVQPFTQLPVDQLRVRINNGPTGRMLLARAEGDTEQWIARDGKAFWTRDGRIVASRGLRDDLHELHVISPMPDLIKLARQRQATEAHSAVFVRSARTPDTGWVLEYRASPSGESLVIQLGAEVRRLQPMEEHVYHPASGEDWTNEYWVDIDAGRILISNQRLPGTPYRVRLEAGNAPTQSPAPLPQAVQEAAQ